MQLTTERAGRALDRRGDGDHLPCGRVFSDTHSAASTGVKIGGTIAISRTMEGFGRAGRRYQCSP